MSDRFDLIYKFWDFLSVKFMVAKYINHGLVRKSIQNPFDSVLAGMNITCKNDHVSLWPGRYE